MKQSIWHRLVRFVCAVIRLLLACAAILLCVAYLVVASWNERWGSPANIAVAPDGTLYVTDTGIPATMFNFVGGHSVWSIDSRRDRVIGLVKSNNRGEGIGVAPNGKVYILPGWLAYCDRTPVDVEVYDPRTSRVSRISVPSPGFQTITFTPAGRALLVGENWYVIDTETDQIINTVWPAPGGSIAMLSEDRFYTASGGLGVIDDDLPVIKWGQAIPRGCSCCDIVLAPGGRVYTSYRRGPYTAYEFGVLVTDMQTDTLIRDIPLSAPVVSMVLLPDSRLYALCNGPKGAYYVAVIDPQTGNVLKTITLGEEPYGHRSMCYPMRRRMVLAPNGRVYVVRGERFGGYLLSPGIGLYVINPTTDTVIKFIPLKPPLWARLFPF